MLVAEPLSNKTAHHVSQALLTRVFCLYGFPETLASDQGKEFVNSILDNMAKICGFKKILTTSYHPAANGQVERTNSTIINIISAFCNEGGTDWSQLLPMSVFAYNTSVHSSTLETPFFLCHGFDPKLPSDLALLSEEPNNLDIPQYRQELIQNLKIAFEKVKENINKAQLKQKNYYDKRNKTIDREFKLGELVLCYKDVAPEGQRTKFFKKWHGPYRIAKVQGSNVTLQSLESPFEPFSTHGNKIKLYYPSEPLPLRSIDEPNQKLTEEKYSKEYKQDEENIIAYAKHSLNKSRDEDSSDFNDEDSSEQEAGPSGLSF
uniref:Integrase catalytic domain-containing protein n=1 Tax=Acrobeloides nanus TaxID=290746 RepID=A0A914CVK8_9BILA